MRLGIVASHESAAAHVEGLAAAAARRGWACRCFLTDSGVRLATSPALTALASAGAIRLDVCEHSWHQFGGEKAPAAANMGTQFNNAELVRECDRVIVVPGRA